MKTKIQAGKSVRLTIPAKLAFNVGKLEKALGNFAELLGCRTCFSGYDCTFLQERGFYINPESLAIDTIPLPESKEYSIPQQQVTVALAPESAFDFKELLKVNRAVLKNFGCPECNSGLDVTYLLQRVQFAHSGGKVDSLGIALRSGVIITDG